MSEDPLFNHSLLQEIADNTERSTAHLLDIVKFLQWVKLVVVISIIAGVLIVLFF